MILSLSSRWDGSRLERNARLADLAFSPSLEENRRNSWSDMSGGDSSIQYNLLGEDVRNYVFRKRTRKKLNEFWTGGNDVEVEGNWEWAGGRGPGESIEC